MAQTFHLELRADGVAVLTLDQPNETYNTFSAAAISEMRALLPELRCNVELKGLVFISGKPDSFVAGADIALIDGCQDAQAATELSQQGQQLFNEISDLPFPVVVAIHGLCLGGGTELALACHYRIVTDDLKNQLGLPEVRLGLLPGAGGTQRLPPLVGIDKALDMMLTGRSIRARAALKMGLVDEVVTKAQLKDRAIALAKQGKPQPQTAPFTKRLVNSHWGAQLVQAWVQRSIRDKRDHYPALEQIIDCALFSLNHPLAQGLQREAKAFGALFASKESKALRQIFFTSTALKRENGELAEAGQPLHAVGVIGGGLMGAGIAYVTANNAHLPVRLRDATNGGLLNALRYSERLLNIKRQRKQITRGDYQQAQSRLSVTLDQQGLNKCDFMIEAVYEDLELKQKVVAELEAQGSPQRVIASNTSSLPISDIAAKAEHPERILGLHYFSPVEKMPLVEIIPHAGSAPEHIATALALAKAQGKMAIVVKDRPGFYLNRILVPYMGEAARLLLEGVKVEVIDQALVARGFPLGPLALLDAVGVATAAKIVPVLTRELGGAVFAIPDLFTPLLNAKRIGKSSGLGIYRYESQFGWKRQHVDKDLYTLLGIRNSIDLSMDEIGERPLLLMLNEAVKALDEGIIASPRDGDIGAIFGIGFPPFLGGVFRYIEQMGLAQFQARLTHYQARYGERFAPAEGLQRRIKQGIGFY